jgi:predicted GIY-YIG superfamily endonuclease
MEPALVSPALYVLRLENDNYYVGMSYNLNFRFAQHWQGKGAKWTKLHKPLEVIRIIYPALEENIENKITLEYIALYGADRVKGGSYCKISG